jgi:hypothetical protein
MDEFAKQSQLPGTGPGQQAGRVGMLARLCKTKPISALRPSRAEGRACETKPICPSAGTNVTHGTEKSYGPPGRASGETKPILTWACLSCLGDGIWSREGVLRESAG